MITFEKSKRLTDVSYEVRGSVLKEAEKMEEQGIDILKLNVGNPASFGFTAPENINNMMAERLREAEGYSDSRGIPAARHAIAEYCKSKKIPNVGINDIYTGNGVSELIVMAMQGLLDQGDEILVPAPDYPLWTAAVTLAGGRAVHYICDERADWNPDINDMKKKITNKTKGIVIINPNNPTGALYPKEILKGIAEIARQNGLILFADEIYDRIVMDKQEHVSIASMASDLFVITMNGLSKSHNIAGFRCGWMCLSGDKSKAKNYIAGLDLLSSMRLCSNVPAQLIIETALKQYDQIDQTLLPGGRLYEQREYITQAVNSIPGLSAVKPKASLYIFPKLNLKKFHIYDDEKFILDFLREKQILMVHGSGFNWIKPDHFRIVYLPCLTDLKTAMERLGDFLQYYRQ